ncbi:hypothetical protein VB638_03130 [Dolichospermum sp. UHCC 0684]|jgi:hypothetical protein|uniref:hypothetical protein n=1 Tax=unclassified Dolichospermum TaxID=2622029 RepID=UPI00144717DE|nr:MULTISPECIES: hypothetical protein [unclassified Dolichospermum]MEA5528591.1 hypothetical protein [Dolichospermum sp. UHCC 0684]MTJ33749.1 hypothetical protein [Dolichospermum sp. UHCC 0260]
MKNPTEFNKKINLPMDAIAVWDVRSAIAKRSVGIAFGLLGVRSLFGYVGMSDRFLGCGDAIAKRCCKQFIE